MDLREVSPAFPISDKLKNNNKKKNLSVLDKRGLSKLNSHRKSNFDPGVKKNPKNKKALCDNCNLMPSLISVSFNDFFSITCRKVRISMCTYYFKLIT